MVKRLSIILLSAAVIAASVGAFVFIDRKQKIAEADERRAASEEAAKAAEARKAKSESETARAKAEAAQLEKETAIKQTELKLAEKEAAEVTKANLEESARVAELKASAARDKAKAAADARAAAEAEFKAAKERKAAEELALRTAEAKAAESANLKAKAEADTLKTKYSLSELEGMKAEYARLIDETQNLRVELEEMKRALTPEKTVADLLTAGDAEAVRTAKKGSEKAETAVLLTEGLRDLLAAEQSGLKLRQDAASRNYEEVIDALKPLLDKAIREKRPIDAKFYFNAITSLYPDWSYAEE